MSRLSIIAAIGRNNELGKDNKLLWHLPSDLKFFKEVTMGKTIVMGYKTYLSLPKRLPNRHYVVLSTKNRKLDNDMKLVHSIDELLDYLSNINDEVFIIGGAKVYEELIDKCSALYITEIDDEQEADAFFPIFNKEDFAKKVIDEITENGIEYKHVIYRRKRDRIF